MIADIMTPEDRMQALIANEPIDRIPVVTLAGLYTARVSGIPFKDYVTDPHKCFRAQCLAVELHGYDDIPSYYSHEGSVWVAWDFGCKVVLNEVSSIPVVIESPVRKPGDIDKLIIPDPKTAPVMSRRLNSARLNRQKGKTANLQVNLTGIASSIIGVERLLKWYYTEPTAVHALYRKVTDYYLSAVDIYIAEFGVENCSFFESSNLDSQNVISPGTFEKYGFMYIKELHQKIVSAGIKNAYVHLCGNHAGTFHCWREVSLPPRTTISVGSEVNMETVANAFNSDCIIAGNVPTSMLNSGSPEEVLYFCKEIIEKVKDRPGGFVLTSACSLPPTTPPVNVHAMVKAAKLYGMYL